MRGCFRWVLVVVGLSAIASAALAQSLTISGPTTAYVGDQIVLDIVGDATGGTADELAYARVRWDPALATGVSFVPTPQTTSFIEGGSGIGPGRANSINLINVPIATSALPDQPVGGQLTLDLIAAGTLELSFDAPFPMLEPRFFGLEPGEAGTWQFTVPEPSKALLQIAGVLGLAAIGRRRRTGSRSQRRLLE